MSFDREQKVPAELGQIDVGELQALAEPEVVETPAQTQAQQQATSGDDLGLAPTTSKFAYTVFEGPLQLGPLEITVKIELELVDVVSSGLAGKEQDKTKTTNVLMNESKLETKGLKLRDNLKSSYKTTVAGTKLMVFGKPVELKFLEASVDSNQLAKMKSRREFMDLTPNLDFVKASTYFSLREVPQFAAIAKQFLDGGHDARLKVELSVKLGSLLPDLDRQELQRVSNLLEDAGKRVADWEKTTGKLLDETEDLATKLKSNGVRKGRFSKNPELADAKRRLREISKELDEIADDPKVATKVLRKLTSAMIKNRVGRVIAKVALKAMTKLTRLIPVVGWVLFAYDVLELGWLGYNIATGRAKFLGGGESISMMGDLWNGFESPGEQPATDEVQREPSEALSKLTPEEQAQLAGATTPVARLIKGLVLQVDEKALEPEHVRRLFDLATARKLTDAQVTEILKRIAENAPKASPDQVLNMLEKILDEIATRPTIDSDGDGRLDGVDTDGNGTADRFDTDGDGVLDGVDKDGDGKADKKSGTGAGKGNGKLSPTNVNATKRKGKGDSDDGENLPSEAVVVDDPLSVGLFVMQETAGGISDPAKTDRQIVTRSGVVACKTARFREGFRPRPMGSDGDLYMEVMVELVIGSASRAGKVTTKIVNRTYEYGWTKATGRFGRMRPTERVDTAVVRALKKKVTTGGTKDIGFRILTITEMTNGVRVKIEITSVSGTVARLVDGKMKEYEVGQTELVDIYTSELAGK
jgi:hypothetical protein